MAYQQPSEADLKKWEEIKTKLIGVSKDLGVVLEELHIAHVEVTAAVAADTDCCCCCTPGCCCTGASSVPVEVAA